MSQRKEYTAEQWIESFKNGEEEGFNFFFREYYAALCYFASQIIKDKEVAEEIASESLLKLWERRSNFESTASIKSFLYKTTKNASLDKIKLEKRSKERIKEHVYFGEERENDVSEKIVQAETFRVIFIIIESLPTECRKIFKMLYLQGKNYEQVSGELNLSPSTIRNQKARALQLIRQRMTFLFLTILYAAYML